MAIKVYEFKVEGVGHFPVDMLRYDQAWPASQDDAANLVGDSELVRQMGRYQILLHSIKEPTVDRWKSFGWQVLNTVIWKNGKIQESKFKVIR